MSASTKDSDLPAVGRSAAERRDVTPRGRLQQVVSGGAVAQPEDLQSILATHLLSTDAFALQLASRREELFAMLLSAPQVDPAEHPEGDEEPVETPPTLDPVAVLDLVQRFDALHRSAMTEIRRNVDLLHRLSAPVRPTVRVVATGKNQVNLGAVQQVRNDTSG